MHCEGRAKGRNQAVLIAVDALNESERRERDFACRKMLLVFYSRLSRNWSFALILILVTKHTQISAMCKFQRPRDLLRRKEHQKKYRSRPISESYICIFMFKPNFGLYSEF